MSKFGTCSECHSEPASPSPARVAQPGGFAVLVADVGDHQHLGVTLQTEFALHMNLQRPEAAAEGDLLRRRDALVAKDQHHMLPVRAQDAVEVRIAQRLR